MDLSKKANSIRIHSLYVTVFLFMSAWIPFFTLYLKKTLTGADGQPILELIAIITAVLPLLALFSNPLAGYIGDKFKIENRILLLCAVFLVISGIFISIPSLFLSNESMELVTIFIFLGIIINGLFIGPVTPILNTEAIEHLNDVGKDAASFGKFRVSGSISWIVSVSAIGLLIYITNNYILIPIFFVFGALLTAVFAIPGVRSKIKPVKIPWERLFNDRKFLLFLIFCFLQGFGLYSSMNFTSYFMDDLGLPVFFIGIAFSVAAIPEIPIMLLSKKIEIKMGSWLMVIIGTAVLLLKLFLLAWFAPYRNSFLIILSMGTHGIGFALQINGMIGLVGKWAHKDLRATYLNLLGLVGISLASAAGNFSSSIVIKYLGSTSMMWINASVTLLAILFFIFFVRDKKSNNNEYR